MEITISEMIASEMPLTFEEREIVDELIPTRTFKKGTVLLKEGEIARNCYFNIQGCVRAYQFVKGEDRTTAFYMEGDAIASLGSYVNQVSASHYWECVEDTTLAVLNYDREKELYKKLPKMEALCRVSIEDEFGKQQEFVSDFLTKKPEERYLDILKNRPELINRVPQYHLATYLGIQPESLSRIRNRVAFKH